MSSQDAPQGSGADPLHGELVAPEGPPGDGDGDGDDENRESVQEPAKVMRIGSMIKQLLDEVRAADLDEPARERLREIYDTSVKELSTALSPDLQDELGRMTIPFGDADPNPSEAELRVAQAQLVGWLEGLFHGIQATLFAQQMAARNQLEEMRRQLPAGAPGAGGPGGPGGQGGPPAGGQMAPENRPGTYL